jgi:hypothetical protein
MPNISVGKTREKPKPPSSKRPGDAARKKRQKDAHKVLEDRKKEPIPCNTVVARVGITLSNVNPDVLIVCGNCEHENWKWLECCAKCKRALDG